MDRIREFIDEYLYQILIGLVAIIVIFMFVIGGMLVGKGDDVSSADDQVAIENSSSQSEAASVSQSASSEQPKQVAAGSNQQMYVDVKGAVKNPGVYQVSANMRVVDAIDLAGGYNRSADKKKINLAQKLTDQQVIYVPFEVRKGHRLPQPSLRAQHLRKPHQMLRQIVLHRQLMGQPAPRNRLI